MLTQTPDTPAQLIKRAGWRSVRAGDAIMHHHSYYDQRVTINDARIITLKKVPDRQAPIGQRPQPESIYSTRRHAPDDFWVGNQHYRK
jgi:hypothetical protein